MLSYSGKSSYHSIRFFECVLESLLIEFSTYHIKCEDNVMILIQTLWRCARTLITTTTLSLLFHYSLSLLLCSTLQGRRKQGAGGGKLPLPLQLLSNMLTLFQSGGRLCPPVIASHCCVSIGCL